MAQLHCLRRFLTICPELEPLCLGLAEKLQESDVYVVDGVYTDYEIRFSDNTSWFKLDHVIPMESPGHISFYIELMVNNLGIWNQGYNDIELDYFFRTMYIYHGSGFPDGSKGFMWQTTVCAPKPIDIGVEEPDGLGEDWGDGSDLAGFVDGGFDSADDGLGSANGGFGSADGGLGSAGIAPEHAISAGDSYDEDETPEVSDRFGESLRQSVASIVPDGITQIRVIALKYNDAVIAFRFKTNVGVFDMRLAVAVGYGLGGFKTETFIKMNSINGILMSESERKKHVLVPDVSECKEDCQKLVNALFGT